MFLNLVYSITFYHSYTNWSNKLKISLSLSANILPFGQEKAIYPIKIKLSAEEPLFQPMGVVLSVVVEKGKAVVPLDEGWSFLQ